MATLAEQQLSRPSAGDERFFLGSALLMALILVAGFSFHLLMGRSTFASPLRVHLHAILFMGWIAIYVTQNALVATDRVRLHRRLGWVAAGWAAAMLVSGFVVTVARIQAGTSPFFFQPLQFLIFDPLAVITFAGLTAAAVLLRRRTEWHRRLHFCGMAMLLGPGLGRLLPLPLLIPWAWEVLFAVTLLFPLAGMCADLRRSGRVHPAWHWGLGVMIASFLLTELLTYGPIGIPIYEAVTDGTAGATVPPLGFAPAP